MLSFKLMMLKIRVMKARIEIEDENLVDGEVFFDETEAGNHD